MIPLPRESAESELTVNDAVLTQMFKLTEEIAVLKHDRMAKAEQAIVGINQAAQQRLAPLDAHVAEANKEKAAKVADEAKAAQAAKDAKVADLEKQLAEAQAEIERLKNPPTDADGVLVPADDTSLIAAVADSMAPKRGAK